MKYFGLFKNRQDLVDQSEWGEDNVPQDGQIIYAAYEVDGYEGSSLVVWQQDGQLFEANDGHCSCNGLDSWRPEATSAGALLMRTYPKWDGLREALSDAGFTVADKE